MKRTNILFWVFNALFAAFMLFSAIPDLMVVPDAIAFVSDKLGYPQYLLPFLGWAKAIGAVAILLPISPRIREWAYAGFFFDLLGATYSGIMVDGFQPEMSFMLLPFTFLALSYIYFHRRLNAGAQGASSGVVQMA